MGKINTLVFAGGAVHDWKGCSEVIIDALSQRDEFEITKVEEDLDALVAPNLDPYDLIVFYYTIGEITDAQKNGLLNHIASGKGYVGVHSAADYFVTHPRYRDYQVNLSIQYRFYVAGRCSACRMDKKLGRWSCILSSTGTRQCLRARLRSGCSKTTFVSWICARGVRA